MVRAGDGAVRSLARLLPVLLPLLWFNATGWIGIDCGRHWDDPLQLRNLQTAIGSETLLPHWYHYPSFCFWLAAAALLPEAFDREDVVGPDRIAVVQERLLAITESPEFLLRLRGLFLFVSSLTIVWVHLLVLVWRGRAGEALLAACLVAGSFEFLYHARWVAPDAILAQFGALSLLGAVIAVVRGRPGGVLLAAAAAGLACGTKYTGGIFLLPVLLAAWHQARSTGRGAPRALLVACVTFAAVFLATTPGALLTPWTFLHDVKYELRHYATLGHYGHTVEAGLEHAALALRYVLLELPSPYAALAAATWILALLGAVALVRDRRVLAVLLLVVPLLYTPYLAQQVILFVRNWLVLLPFAALLAARGAGWLLDLLPRAGARLTLVAGLAALVTVNGAYLWTSAASIRDRDRDRYVLELARWIEDHPGRTVYLSPTVTAEWRRAALPPRDHVTSDPAAEVDAAAFYPDETMGLLRIPSNVPGAVLAAFGPQDRNFEWYTSWPEPRLVLAPAALARDWGILGGGRSRGPR